jgi:regulator of replication initiation timing
MADETYTKADLDKLIKDAVDDATKGLKDNLTAALDEAKEAKRKLRAASEIKPEDLTALETENDKLRADLATANKTAKDATAAAEKATKALTTEQSVTHKLIAENGLREQLAANGVTNPVHQKAAMALLGSQVQVVSEGDTALPRPATRRLPISSRNGRRATRASTSLRLLPTQAVALPVVARVQPARRCCARRSMRCLMPIAQPSPRTAAFGGRSSLLTKRPRFSCSCPGGGNLPGWSLLGGAKHRASSASLSFDAAHVGLYE